MTREEAFEHAKRIRNKTKDASVIVLDGECIDAILSNTWRKVSEELPRREGMYFVHYTDGYYDTSYYLNRFLNESRGGAVDYWMPIPKINEAHKNLKRFP